MLEILLWHCEAQRCLLDVSKQGIVVQVANITKLLSMCRNYSAKSHNHCLQSKYVPVFLLNYLVLAKLHPFRFI